MVQQPRMIVLALIAQGRNYGLAMEEFVERSRMRLWAKIGGSTIYKALKDLERDKCVTGKKSDAKRGPGKTVFKLTAKGTAELEAQVSEALTSDASVYSDRIAGLILSLSLPRTKAKALIRQSLVGLDGALSDIKAEQKRQQGDRVAEIVLDYYATLLKAEQTAMKRMLDEVLTR